MFSARLLVLLENLWHLDMPHQGNPLELVFVKPHMGLSFLQIYSSKGKGIVLYRPTILQSKFEDKEVKVRDPHENPCCGLKRASDLG